MKPFSPFCFIKNNFKRSLTLILLITTVGFCYIGGVYFNAATEHYSDIYDSSKDLYMFFEKNNEGAEKEFKNAYSEIESSSVISKIIYTNWNNYFYCKNVMSFDYGTEILGFKSSDDFDYFNEVTKVVPSDLHLDPGEIAITDKIAKQFDLKVGDKIDPEGTDENIDISEPYIVKAIFNAKSYRSYAVNKTTECKTPIALRNFSDNETSDQINNARNEMNSYFDGLISKYPNMNFRSHTYFMDNMKSWFNTFYMIYYSICALVTLVIAVTLNALFVGAYQKRKFEFSVYKAVGFSKREINRKIISEVLIINLLGLISAAILTVLALFLINNIILYPEGLWMEYFSFKSLIIAAICDVMLIVPVIFLRIKKIKKYDVTEY